MVKEIVMPALGMAQETGTLLQWLKAPGDAVSKGEPLMEVETDKATVEVEAPASGILANVTAQPGDVIPVGQTIAVLLSPGENTPPVSTPQANTAPAEIAATPIARRIAAEHNLDLAQVKPQHGRVRKDDVLSFLAVQSQPAAPLLASPKARRLAQERGIELKTIPGSGPDGAVLAADVLAASPAPVEYAVSDSLNGGAALPTSEIMTVSRTWRVMVERLSQTWATVPHFYLLREVNATHLIAWLSDVRGRTAEKVTYTDLLVKVTAAALRQHPRLNASWRNDTITLNPDINIGLAVAIDDGLVVPVIHQADKLGLAQLAARRIELVTKAQAGKLTPNDLGGGTFTISNLGMYNIDAFNAIVNAPQAAILAVGRIVERVVAQEGKPVVRPILTMTLSCDHRVVDGLRGAEFLDTLAKLIEDPNLD